MPSCLQMLEREKESGGKEKERERIYTQFFFCLFPRHNHAHWLAAREATSQHVHHWGQVSALCCPSPHQCKTKWGNWGAGTVWGRRILLTPESHSVPIACCPTSGVAQGKPAKQMKAHDVEFLFLSLFGMWVWIFLAESVDARASPPRVKFWLPRDLGQASLLSVPQFSAL